MLKDHIPLFLESCYFCKYIKLYIIITDALVCHCLNFKLLPGYKRIEEVQDFELMY